MPEPPEDGELEALFDYVHEDATLISAVTSGPA